MGKFIPFLVHEWVHVNIWQTMSHVKGNYKTIIHCKVLFTANLDRLVIYTNAVPFHLW